MDGWVKVKREWWNCIRKEGIKLKTKPKTGTNPKTKTIRDENYLPSQSVSFHPARTIYDQIVWSLTRVNIEGWDQIELNISLLWVAVGCDLMRNGNYFCLPTQLVCLSICWLVGIWVYIFRYSLVWIEEEWKPSLRVN